MGDIDEKSILQITEMGFSYEDAIKALTATNGDVNAALNHMFNFNDAEPPSYEMDTVDISSVKELRNDASQEDVRINQTHAPDLPQRPNNDYNASIHVEDVNYGSSKTPSSGFVYNSDGYGQDADSFDDDEASEREYNDYSVYDDIQKYLRPEFSPPVLIPLSGGIYESYLNPILTILHEIPSFRKAVYHYHFNTLNFTPNWFKGEAIAVSPDVTSIQKDKNSYDLRFLMETQRLFGFLDGDSNRAFASMNNFIKAFPKEVQAKYGDIDSMNDAYYWFYSALSKQLKLSGVENGAINYFESTLVDSSDENDSGRAFGMFHIETSEIRQNLYKTLHNLLWDTDNSKTLSELSEIISICLEPSTSDDDITPNGLQISEQFYPQVYTTEFKPIIDDILAKQKSYSDQVSFLANQLMKTRVHNGKNISENLKRSIDFLKSESNDSKITNTVEELTQIEIKLNEMKNNLNDQQNHFQELRKVNSPLNIKLILESSGKDLDSIEPYILTGVIIKPSLFLYLKPIKDSETREITSFVWNYIEYSTDAGGKDFTTRTVDFNDIKRAVYSYTSQEFEYPILLTYVRETMFLEDVDAVLPDSVKEFISKDKEELHKILEFLKDDDDLIDLDDENVGVTTEQLKDEELGDFE